MKERDLLALSLEELEQLARANSTDRALLANVRLQFMHRSSPEKAKNITNMIMALSSSPAPSKLVLSASTRLPELQTYFQQRAFNDANALRELLELLEQREGQASQSLAEEVRARLRLLQASTTSPAPRAASPPRVTNTPAAPMAQEKYLQLLQVCRENTASPEQVQALLAELERRGIRKDHPLLKSLPLASKTSPPPTSAAGAGTTTPLGGPSRFPSAVQNKPAPPLRQPEGPASGSASWLAERKKAREARKHERPPARSYGFIEVRSLPTRQMIDVYLGSPEHLIATVARLKKSATKARNPQGISEADLAAAMDRLNKKSWKDEAARRRDRRLIPYLLLAGNPAYVSRFGLAPFIQELEQDERLTLLKEMIQRYFHAEFEHYPRHRVELGAWIREKLSRIDLAKCRRTWVHHYHQYRTLFSADPVGFAASFLPPSREDWSCWEDLEIPTTSWLYGEAMAEGVRVAMRSGNSRQVDEIYARLQRTVPTDVTGSNTRIVYEPVESLAVRRKCVEAALLEHVHRKTVSPEPTLIAFALDTLKDPRQKDSAHWYGVHLEAKALMEAWLSIEDLELFFGELADDSDEKSRVQYWKPFVFNRCVSSSRIFLGEGVIRRKRGKVQKYLSSGRYGRLEGSGSDEVCAFVLRIRDAIVVEFSKVNNACFIYDAKRFDPNLMGMKTVTINELKNTAAAKKLPHTPNWPGRFDEFLYREYGVRRPGS